MNLSFNHVVFTFFSTHPIKVPEKTALWNYPGCTFTTSSSPLSASPPLPLSTSGEKGINFILAKNEHVNKSRRTLNKQSAFYISCLNKPLGKEFCFLSHTYELPRVLRDRYPARRKERKKWTRSEKKTKEADIANTNQSLTSTSTAWCNWCLSGWQANENTRAASKLGKLLSDDCFSFSGCVRELEVCCCPTYLTTDKITSMHNKV